MNDLIGKAIAHQHDQARIGQNQGIGLHRDNRFDIAQIGFQLGVVRCDIVGHIEAFT